MIKSLFKDGSVGGYWNLQDPSSRLDNGLIPDLSGQGNAWAQTTPSQKAQFIQDANGYWSLKFDGIDDGYVTRSIDFSKTDKITVILAIKKNSEQAGMILGLSDNANGAVPNGFRIIRGGNFNDQGFNSGFKSYQVHTPFAETPTNVGLLYRAIFKTNNQAPSTFVRVNNKARQVDAQCPDASFGNYPMYLGRSIASSATDISIYAMLVIGKLLDDATTAKIEKEFAKYIGVTP